VHGSHVTLKAIKQAQEFKLTMITLHAHTSHALEVSCFKLFKTTLKNVKDVIMARNNYMELNKIALVGFVDQTLNKSLAK